MHPVVTAPLASPPRLASHIGPHSAGKDFENCEIMSFVLETSTGSLVLAEADLVEVK